MEPTSGSERHRATVVVTGGAGFIGGNLVAALAAAPGVGEVRVVDDLSTGDRANLAGIDADLRIGSVLDPEVLAPALAGADSVVHLAAVPSVPRSIADPVTSFDVNAVGTVRVLEAARAAGVEHVVVASSSSVYGANPELPKHEGLVPRPLSPYAASKLAAEQSALAWSHSYGLGVLAFRFFNVFGPLQAAGHAYAAVVPAFVDAALAGRPLPIHGDGGQSRDFTFVGTVVEVIVDAVRRRVVHDGPVNLAFGGRTSLLELVDLLEGVIGRPLAREHLPVRPGDVPHSQADQRILRALFPDVHPVPLDEALAATVAWYRRQRPPDG